MKGFIIYPTYRITAGKSQVMLFGKLENGESFTTIHDFAPYFWIKRSDKQKAEKVLKDLNAENIKMQDSEYKNFDAEPMEKVIVQVPKQVADLRKTFQDNNIVCYECDIRFPYRFMIDYDIKACIDIEGNYKKPTPEEGLFVERVYENPTITPIEYLPNLNVLSIDIETTMDASKVLSIGLYSNYVKQVLLLKNEGEYPNTHIFPTEKELLEAFKRFIQQIDPDIITGWNLIDFDFKVLRDRFKANDVPFVLGRTSDECSLRLSESFFTDSSADFPGRMVIDAIHMMKVSFIRMEDYKLNTVSKAILGEGKLIESNDRSEEVERLYAKDLKRLVEYNLKDAELVWKILEKTKVLSLSIRRSMLTRMQIDRVNASIASFDSLYLRKLKEIKVIAPSSFNNDSEERIKGGFVMDSKPGMYSGIVVLDFKSLYPSIIRTFNIDPYSHVPQENYAKLLEKEKSKLIEAPNGAHFKNQQGILPGIIESLWKQRDEAKKRKDELANQAIKILMNSFFGVLANPTCRFYSLEVANAITHFGQYLNKLTASKIREKGYDVIYGDTDSIFFNANTTDLDEAEKIGIELQEYINDFYVNFIKERYNRVSHLELEFDKAFKKFLMPKVRGSEVGAKKRYAGIIMEDGKEKLTVTGLEVVRRDWTDLAKKFQTELLDHIFHDKPVDSYVREFVESLKQGKMDNLLVYRKAIRKGVAEYTKTTPPHIKAARKIGREEKGLIEYVMTKNGPEPLEQTTSRIDYDHYIEKQIKPIADSVMSFQDKTFEDMVSNHKQKGLGEWF